MHCHQQQLDLSINDKYNTCHSQAVTIQASTTTTETSGTVSELNLPSKKLPGKVSLFTSPKTDSTYTRNKASLAVYPVQLAARSYSTSNITLNLSENNSSKLSKMSSDSQKLKVALVGSGNWGSAIASIIGKNVTKFPNLFDDTIKMYVYEEMVDGKKLTEIINTQHENVKYLPGIKFPANIVANADVLDTTIDADILIFVLPHAFVPRTCAPLIGKIKSSAFAISLIKGFGEKDGKFVLMSSVIEDHLKIPCSVLMGANLANEVARGDFCESTIGCKDPKQGEILKNLFHTENFMITVVPDVYTVEICGALKNIVACAAGFSEGLGMGDNTKAAVIRLGLKEMIRFCKTFFPSGFDQATFFESCGVADLVTTCYGGRNRRVSLEFAKQNGAKTLEDLEKEMLNGQKLQGPQTASEVYELLTEKKMLERWALFTLLLF